MNRSLCYSTAVSWNPWKFCENVGLSHQNLRIMGFGNIDLLRNFLWVIHEKLFEEWHNFFFEDYGEYDLTTAEYVLVGTSVGLM